MSEHTDKQQARLTMEVVRQRLHRARIKWERRGKLSGHQQSVSTDPGWVKFSVCLLVHRCNGRWRCAGAASLPSLLRRFLRYYNGLRLVTAITAPCKPISCPLGALVLIHAMFNFEMSPAGTMGITHLQRRHWKSALPLPTDGRGGAGFRYGGNECKPRD